MVEEYFCPFCPFVAKSGSGLAAHIRKCETRPTVEDLRRLCEEGLSTTGIARECDASHATVRRWLREAGLTAGPGGKKKAVEDLVIFIAYAVKRDDVSECSKCDAQEVCPEFVMKMGWMLCEAPDKEQRESWERQGIDILQVTTELWERMPELWENGKRNGRGNGRGNGTGGRK
jgi:hypothetical protein